MKLPLLVSLTGLVLASSPPLSAQTRAPRHHQHLIPITRPIAPAQFTNPVRVTKAEARIRITSDQLAVTTLDLFLHNPSNRIEEAELVLPVPHGSVLHRFTFLGTQPEATAKLLPKDEARRIYDSIVAQTRDPALLEFIGTDLIQSSIFPVPARGDQRIQITWETLLRADGNRLDYYLPRSEALEYRVPWTFTVEVETGGVSLFSPSHELRVRPTSPHSIRATAKTSTTPGPFQLSLLRQSPNGQPTASLVAYPDPKVGGGYFLLLMAPPPVSSDAPVLKREVTIVLDRSGSMRGEKLDQVRESALQILEALEPGERFNLITYNEAVESLERAPVVKTRQSMKAARAYLRNLRVSGGTNIHDALVEALRQPAPPARHIPLVLFLTDGLPTIGQTTEKAIREAAALGNRSERRIFTVGVGVDVNTPLLNRLSRESRAISTYVLPHEDVEVKVGGIFNRLSAPVLGRPRIATTEPGRVTDLLPSDLPDLFAGDQLVLLGQYRDEKPLQFLLEGEASGGPRSFHLPFELDHASTRNAYVARLWASHKIGILTEAIRDQGADGGTGDPRLQELVDEVVRLSTEFGILTEYTAFFAEEGTDFTEADAIQQRTTSNYLERAFKSRSGLGSVSQDFNTKRQIETQTLNRSNAYWDGRMQTAEVTNVQQLNDRTYYKRGLQWIDSRMITSPKAAAPPDRIVEIGSAAFHALVDQLAASHRLGCFALTGQLLLEIDGESVLVK